jgi:pyruvate formate lyase activating enzyme
MTSSMNTGNAVRDEIEPGVARGEWWHRLENGRFPCELCPRFCKLHEGEKA